MAADWLFADPPNVATFTMRRIVKGKNSILLVVHDADDGGWQFLDGGSVNMDDAMLVGLGTIFKCDPSIAELADLPLGWEASRSAIDQPWKRK